MDEDCVYEVDSTVDSVVASMLVGDSSLAQLHLLLDMWLSDVWDRYDVPAGQKVDATRKAHRSLDKAWAAQVLAQRSWPARTDNDRLDAAMAELTANGVVGLSNFSCCNRCGHSEAQSLLEEKFPQASGYAFFHIQDVEGAVECGGLSMRFGPSPKFSDEQWEGQGLLVGDYVVSVLNRHGLRTEWNHTNAQCINIPDLVWQKRIG